MSDKVVISRKIPTEGIELLRKAGFMIDYHDSDTPLDSADLKERCKGAFGLICLLDDKIPAEFLEENTALRVVANYAVGYDNIDIHMAKTQGIRISNTPDVLSRASADLAFSLLLAVARRIVESHNYLQNRKAQGGFDGWGSTLMLGSEISGKILGVLGAGRIGSVMARRGLGFDMEVIYHARSSKPELDDLGCKFVNLDTLIETSDFLSIHLPLTEETQGLFDKQRLLQMKSGSYLINTGRGKIIQEADLVEVLQEGHLAGAGLDVFENEPQIHPELYELSNVVMTPHIGSATFWARNKMSLLCAEAIIAVRDGKEADHFII